MAGRLQGGRQRRHCRLCYQRWAGARVGPSQGRWRVEWSGGIPYGRPWVVPPARPRTFLVTGGTSPRPLARGGDPSGLPLDGRYAPARRRPYPHPSPLQGGEGDIRRVSLRYILGRRTRPAAEPPKLSRPPPRRFGNWGRGPQSGSPPQRRGIPAVHLGLAHSPGGRGGIAASASGVGLGRGLDLRRGVFFGGRRVVIAAETLDTAARLAIIFTN